MNVTSKYFRIEITCRMRRIQIPQVIEKLQMTNDK